MKPLILTMQAFGPYAGCETIDFTKLENRTMFVISGKTGAGKTTIFDGISFAIYGKASGEDRSGQDMRSQFADNHVVTEVSLRFTLREKTYFIYRSPQQEKMKKSGEGTTSVGAKAELYELLANGEKKLLGANVREVDDKIKSIIGLDANQFRQILMIPQGEFRKLLTSESKEKEQILQKLFHTERYKRMEEILKEDAMYLKRECEKNFQARMELLKGIIVHDDEELQQAIVTDEPNEQLILPLLANEIAATVEKSDDCDRQIHEKQQARDFLHQEITKAEQLLRQFLEKEQLYKEKEQLATERPAIEKMKEHLKRAHRALELEKQEQYYLRIGEQVQKVNQEFAKYVQEVEQLEAKRQELEKEYQSELKKENEREETVRKVHQLQQLKTMLVSFVELTTEVEEKEQQWKACVAKRKTTEDTVTQKERLIEEISLEKADAEKATLLYSERAREAEIQERLLKKLTKWSEGLKELAKLEQLKNEKAEGLTIKTEGYAQAFQVYTSLEETWRNSQAGMLAATLEEGHACPVCGATEHPQPAHIFQDVLSDVEMKQQKQHLTEAEAQKRQAEREFFQVDSQFISFQNAMSEQEVELKGIVPEFQSDEWSVYQQNCQNQWNALQTELNSLLQKKEALPRLELQWTNLKKESIHLKEDFEQLKSKEEQAKMVYIEQKTKLAGLADSLPEQIRTEQAYSSALTEAVQVKNNLQKAFERAQTSLQEVKQQESAIRAKKESLEEHAKTLQIELDEERQKFIEDLTKHEFASYKEYNAAKRTEEERKALEEQIQQYDQQWQKVISLYHNMELKLKDVAQPDLEGLKLTFNMCDVELEKLRTQYNELIHAKQKNEEIQLKLAQMKEIQQEMEERYTIVGHLYEMAKGQNPFRITFERYVLAAFLDDILKEANTRLLKMTSGRYQLLRKLDPTRRNIQSGLELSVYDQYTSQERHVKTLSGGESFKASLALALGLADVVQQHAGGISLETMFIDEGFGTLDPESLDQAIEALMDIQSSGRLVGIISHVPELKERIDAQLEVEATQNGSKTSFSFSS